jgi:LmbE family N-acetylglucosaminyl deacetylase
VNAPQWNGHTPTVRDRLVVIAPHPDDEVFAAAGLMRWTWESGVPVEIIAVTDGEGSHPDSSLITPMDLTARRAAEREAALATLRLAGVPVHRLGLPDGDVAGHERELETMLAVLTDRSTVLVSPPPDDGHPDHDATGRAAMQAAGRMGSACWFTPIWSRVAHVDRAASAVLDLHDLHPVKRRAAECFVSQLQPLGPDAADGPVVHPREMEALVTRTEAVVEAVP